jgi:hypothetical protein
LPNPSCKPSKRSSACARYASKMNDRPDAKAFAVVRLQKAGNREQLSQADRGCVFPPILDRVVTIE